MAVLEYPVQRGVALGRANGVRDAIVDLKAELAALPAAEATLRAAAMLRDGDARIGRIKVHSFLLAIPRIGDVKAQMLLTRPGEYVWPLKRLGALTVRQRLRLADELRALASASVQLSVMEEAILAALESAREPMSAYDIADEVGLSPRSMSSRLFGLRHRGLVDRVVLREGHRPHHGYFLTEEGRAAA